MLAAIGISEQSTFAYCAQLPAADSPFQLCENLFFVMAPDIFRHGLDFRKHADSISGGEGVPSSVIAKDCSGSSSFFSVSVSKGFPPFCICFTSIWIIIEIHRRIITHRTSVRNRYARVRRSFTICSVWSSPSILYAYECLVERWGICSVNTR